MAPAPAHLVVVDGNIQVSGRAPLEPGGHDASGTKAQIGHSELGGSRRIGGVCGEQTHSEVKDMLLWLGHSIHSNESIYLT